MMAHRFRLVETFAEHGDIEDATAGQERIRAKGALSRKRTIIAGADGVPTVDASCEPAKPSAL